MTFPELNDAMYDALHDFALSNNTIQRRICAMAVLVACFQFQLRYPRLSTSCVAVSRTTVMPFVSQHGLTLFQAAARRKGLLLTDDVLSHLMNMVRRSNEDRLVVV